MSECVKLQCCIPDTFAQNRDCEPTRYLNSVYILECDGSHTAAIVIPAGAYESLISQEDADRLAEVAAREMRRYNPCVWFNEAQSYTATCTPPAVGSVTVDIAAGTYSSQTSVADANALALAAATQQANETLVCS